MKKRITSALLAICIMLTLLPTAALAADAAVYSIRGVTVASQANTVSVQLTAEGDCVLCVALYAENGQMLDSKLYDIVKSTEEQVVSGALPADRPEEFAIKAFLLDRTSHAPLCEVFSADSGVIIDTDAELYSVTALRVEDSSVIATVYAESACVIRLAVETADGGTVLFTENAGVETEGEMAEVAIPLNSTLPEEFRLTARLVSEDGLFLGSSYTTRAYTKAYQESISKTPEDFPADQVLDFGEDGFGVLTEDVERVSAPATEADGLYTFPADRAPQVGEVLLLTLKDGTEVPVKVGAVTAGGDRAYTVTPDMDVTVSDFYDYLLVDSALYVEGEGDQGEAALLDASAKLPTFSIGDDYGPVNVKVEGGATLYAHLYIDKDTDPDYFEVAVSISVKAGVTVTVKEAYDSSKHHSAMGDDPLEFTLYTSPYFPVGTTGLWWQFDLAWQTTFKFEASGSISGSLIAESGVQYDSENGVQKIWDKDVDASVTLSGGFEVSTGLKLSGTLRSLALPLEVSVSGGVPFALKGTASLIDMTEDKIHGCDLCLNVKLAISPSISATLKAEFSDKLSVKLLSVTLIKATLTLKQGYVSVKNPADSLFKGELTYGWGACPNYKYRVDFRAEDKNGNPLDGQTIELLKDGQTVGTVVSGGSLFLYNGSYTARMIRGEGRSFETKFTVSGGTASVTVKEKTSIVRLQVTDEDTGKALSGVSVSYTDNVAGRTSSSYTTEEDGLLTFQLLPGSHTFTGTLDKYNGSSKTVDITEASTVSLQMKRTEPYARLTVNIVDQNGDPVKTIPFGVRTQDGEYVDGGLGTAVTLLLDKGTYTVATTPLSSAYSSDSATVTLAAGEERTITLTAEKNGVTLSGVVTGVSAEGEEAPLSGVTVTASQNGATVDSATTGEDGSYELVLPVGDYTIAASKVRYESKSVSLTLSGNQAEQNFKLEEQSVGWNLVDGVLTIWGEGPMDDYEKYMEYIPNNVHISPWHSERTSITEVVVEEGVTSIGNYAFQNCTQLTSITIPDSVTSIGQYAFYNCTRLTDFTVPDNVTQMGVGVFYGCTGLTSFTIPDSYVSIGSYMFYGCTGLTSVTIPDSVTSIGAYAFANCTSLTSITIPDRVTYISEGVFGGCYNLTNVNIPGGVTSIASNAFYNCSGLTSIIIPEGVTSIGKSAFYYCSGLTNITIPESVTSIGSYAFQYCTRLTSINIPDSVTFIGGSAFYYCSSLTNITIPEGVTSIGSTTFYQCKNLSSVIIPDSVTAIGDKAFWGCISLASVTIPEGVTSIGTYTFLDCRSLTKVVIPEGVTSIGMQAFSRCSSLTSIIIPGSVTSMSSGALQSCANLTDIYYGGTEEQWAAACSGVNIGIDASTVTIHYNSV